MIIVGIDDTDVVGSRGTNQLARQIVRELAPDCRCVRIVRHQLLDDPRVPYTSKNGSASIALLCRQHSLRSPDVIGGAPSPAKMVLDCCRRVMREWYIEGSDPGLCLLAGECPAAVIAWGLRCQNELVSREEALVIAAETGVHLEGLGGTHDGVIGALAAVGLASTADDGRVVQLGEWPDDLSGMQQVEVLTARDVWVRDIQSHRYIAHGQVDVGKHLRPNVRQGATVLFVEDDSERLPDTYHAVRLP